MPSSPDRPVDARPRASIGGAWLEGWRRVLGAPALTAGLALLTLATTLPLALAVRGALAQHLGSSQTSERLLEEWDPRWAAEFSVQARGVAATFTHEILGAGGTVAAVSGVADGIAPPPAILAAAGLYVALWLFLSGGILDRLARARPIRTAAFFAASGTFFVRFLRLALVFGLAYWAIFRWLHPLLFDTVWDRWTQDLTSETVALRLRFALYGVLATVLMVVGIVADFARVRAVVEDRRSMLAAIAASLRFVRRRFWRVVGLYLANIAGVALVMALWLWIDPPLSWAPWLAFAAAQLYLVLRIAAKLAFLASEVAFFQQELAHAHYTALPEPVWPESPGVEAIR